jgi:hypothetical protein
MPWFGVTVTNNRVTSIDLSDNNLEGTVPAILTDIENLEIIDFSGNEIKKLPDLTSLVNINSFDVSGNQLDFASLESNVTLPGSVYDDQTPIGTSSTVIVHSGDPHSFEMKVGGTQNRYHWFLNDLELTDDTTSSYSINGAGRAHAGRYKGEVTNPLVPGLTLVTGVDTLIVVANISGKVFADNQTPATHGTVRLFRINSEGAYDSLDAYNINDQGSYFMENIVLDNYQVLSSLDTNTHSRALPTYYKNTIFWEEADTVFLNNDSDSLDIHTQYKPSAIPQGKGMISGYLVEDDGLDGGRSKGNKRIGGAGVSARKIERNGRGKEEIVLTLIAHQFTDAEGEFSFSHLVAGEYRLNIQYPGYPMDENSFIDIPVGEGINAGKHVEARVQDGMIVVTELVITHVWALEDYHVDLYPNPTVEFVNLEFVVESRSRKIALYDMSGKKLINQAAPRRKESVDVRSLKNGHYMLNVEDNGGIVKSMQVIIK